METRVDERMAAALARLTENERVCLRRRLAHQTAKEMAIDLGISPQSVEKRLKMARAKLGVSSSLEAARLLAEYQPPVPPPADLAEAVSTGEDSAGSPHRRRIAILAGVLFMFVLAALLLTQSVPDGPARPAAPPGTRSIEELAFRPATRAELRAFCAESFRLMDRDRSGFIERDEAPASGIGLGEPHPAGVTPPKDEPIRWIGGTMGQAMWISNLDTDADGKASEAEYLAWDMPLFEHRGVPVGWRPAPGRD